jgi:hypothetical protein
MHPQSFNGTGVTTTDGIFEELSMVHGSEVVEPNLVNHSVSYALHQLLAIFVPGYVLKY